MPSPKEIKSFALEVAREFSADRCTNLAAALSYYTLFSLAPFLIVVIACAGLFFGHEAVTGEIYAQLDGLLGANGARAVQEMVKNAYQPKAGMLATAIGTVTLLVGATSVFVQLQTALNQIWQVKPRPRRGVLKMVRDRVLSFGLVLGIGFLLLVSLVAHGLISAFGRWIDAALYGHSAALLWTIETSFSLALMTLLFAMIYKFLPDVKTRWRDMWVGAFVTSALFSVGKVGIGLYLGHSHLATTYGAAAAILIVIVWVNYSSTILFLGAEFTQVWSERYGGHIAPADYAVRLERVEAELERGSEARHVPTTRRV